jgi:hypothetical protein
MSGRLAELDEDAHNVEIDGPPGDGADETSTKTIASSVDDLQRLSLVWRVKMTQVQMLEDRGYELTPFDLELREKATSPTEFWNLVVSKIPSLVDPDSKSYTVTALWDLLTETYVSKKDSQTRNLVVFLPPPLAKAFPTMRLNRVISVVKRDPTLRYLDVIYEFPMTKLVRTKLGVTNRVVAEWSFADLQMPILRSVYVGGKFRTLSPAEFQEYYKADPVAARAGLPIICRDDPLARYHQWTVDTVVRSTEVGDVNVAVTRLLKDYVVSSATIFAAIDSVEQPKS